MQHSTTTTATIRVAGKTLTVTHDTEHYTEGRRYRVVKASPANTYLKHNSYHAKRDEARERRRQLEAQGFITKVVDRLTNSIVS